MNKQNQRKGSISNAHVGAAFEAVVLEYFGNKGIALERNFALEIGVGKTKKKHCFDLGSKEPQIIIECKSHTWTEGNKVPVAKMTVWNEAMYYFHLVPDSYKKILFVSTTKERAPELVCSIIIYILTVTSFRMGSILLNMMNHPAKSLNRKATEPNQSLEPTRMLVTDPAAQAPRQAPVRLI